MDEGSKTVTAQIKVNSLLDSAVPVDIGVLDEGSSIIEGASLDLDFIQPGKDQEMTMTIKLLDDIEEGDHMVSVPVLIDGVYAKNIEVSFSSRGGIFGLDFKTLVGLILIMLSLIPLIFLLYTIVNLRKLGISIANPRIIVEFALFLAFFIAGLIVTFI